MPAGGSAMAHESTSNVIVRAIARA